AVRGAGAGGGAAGPRRCGTRAAGRPLLLSRLGGGVSGRLGHGGPDVRRIPRRRSASALRDRRSGPASGARPPDRAAHARGAMIRLENLTKHYGSFVAVDDISLEVPRGVLYGFLGPNGAGKTTTLRMIAGILRPTDGRVLLGGDNVHDNPTAAKMRLGFIPDRPFVYDKLTGAEFLRFVAGLYGQEGDTVKRRTALQRLREERSRGGSGKLLLLIAVGLLFWVGVYGVLYLILKHVRSAEELGPFLAAKILGLVLLSFVTILVLSNVITALSS